MRVFRIPYVYIGTQQLKGMHYKLHAKLNIIRDIHLGIPNLFHDDKCVRHYQYYPSFLRWSHDKAVAELLARGEKHHSPLSDDICNLKSRSLDYFLPPTDMEIAEDVVYLVERWKYGRYPGGQKLPWSYLQLAQNVYGYSPKESALEGIGELSGHHYHNDAGWYHV